MTRSEEESMRALAACLFDRTTPVERERLDWAIVDLGAFLRSAGPRTSLIFSAALFFVAWMPLFFVGRIGPLSRLSSDQAALYLEKLDRSRFSMLLLLPKALFSLVYFEHPDALKEIGFDGSCLMGELPAGVGHVRLNARISGGATSGGLRLAGAAPRAARAEERQPARDRAPAPRASE